MRLKIIAGNFLIVLIVGVTSYFLVRTQVEAAASSELSSSVAHDAELLDRSLRLSALEFIELVKERAATPAVRGALGGLDEESRRRRAHSASDAVATWFGDPSRGRGGPPDLVFVADETGKVIARNQDINRMAGQQLSQSLPALRLALQNDAAMHDAWQEPELHKVFQTAVAPIHNDDGAVIGALVVGYDLSNGLAQTEAERLGRTVAFVEADKVYSSSFDSSVANTLQQALFGPQRSATESALGGATTPTTHVTLGGAEYVMAMGPLPHAPSLHIAYAVLGGETEARSIAGPTTVILVMTLLGVFGVIVFGFLLGGSFMRPLEEIEEGVLAIINGRTDLRLDIDSAEFGGLAYRINQLVNVFTGVSEDDGTGSSTEGGGSWEGVEGGGGPSGSVARPAAAGGGGGGAPIDDPNVAAQLAAEAEAAYYSRVYREYVAAKKALGEDMSNIPEERFVQRLKGNESSLAQKHGCRAVRFQVHTEGNQVILRPVLIR